MSPRRSGSFDSPIRSPRWRRRPRAGSDGCNGPAAGGRSRERGGQPAAWGAFGTTPVDRGTGSRADRSPSGRSGTAFRRQSPASGSCRPESPSLAARRDLPAANRALREARDRVRPIRQTATARGRAGPVERFPAPRPGSDPVSGVDSRSPRSRVRRIVRQRCGPRNIDRDPAGLFLCIKGTEPHNSVTPYPQPCSQRRGVVPRLSPVATHLTKRQRASKPVSARGKRVPRNCL